MLCFSVFMMTIVPVFIMPLFNKYEPLPDGDLKRRIFELAASLKYPLVGFLYCRRVVSFGMY